MSRRGALYSGMCTDLNDEFWNRDGDEPDGPFKHVFETYVLAWILSTPFTGDGFIAFPITSFKPRRPERTEPRGDASSGRTHGTGSTAHPDRCADRRQVRRSEEHTSELQSRPHLVCRLLLEKKKQKLK